MVVFVEVLSLLFFCFFFFFSSRRRHTRFDCDWSSDVCSSDLTRFSPLADINTGNVKELGLSWAFDIGPGGGGQEATPIVANGVIYGITNWSVVFAVDARTGKEKWRWDPWVERDRVRPEVCCGIVNRGVALYKGLVIAPIIDGRLQAL